MGSKAVTESKKKRELRIYMISIVKNFRAGFITRLYSHHPMYINIFIFTDAQQKKKTPPIRQDNTKD